ncbi:MAG: hypothetical protein ACI8QC_003906 [Planctomycetota bacterium]|jgi:hypothetical protein
MDTSRARYPRWLRVTLVLECGLPSLIFLAMVRDGMALVVPFAGPWAARLYGHSCGVDSFLPAGAWGLLVLGAMSMALAIRFKRPRAVIPAALLWWPAWLLAALASMANMSS